MREETFGKKSLNLVQNLLGAFDVTGIFEQRRAEIIRRRQEILLRKNIREARREARAQRLEEYRRLEESYKSLRARMAAEQLERIRQRVDLYRHANEDGFMRDAEALGSDWDAVGRDMQRAIDRCESEHSDSSQNSSLCHVP